ncbi:5'-3' exonuclease [Yinghuangia sp. KLBMP8922]|uniref:5'-3' exonuclease n=2 Tax=Yinghuangia soli TaxID=2908204 RepID=A0AA41U2T7_9ACTN|nr:5'-3' exonuclease [Yinghuangia soli]MCF2527444.1 5'-3' exonuclease [Yinghuangia soli]
MLLDTASLYFRAYFGVPESMKAPDGTPVNAVRGLLDFISRLVADHRPDQLVACWDDDWRPQFRVDAIPSYKAHRVAEEVEGDAPDTEEVPDTLSPQVPVIEEVLAAFGIARVGSPGFEADDVIGTFATQSLLPVDIVTGDRDLFQLVDDKRGVRVLYPVKGVGVVDVMDEAAVLAKYAVPASSYADFATLRGDASDGLPGVKGIGEKTAAQLIAEFGDLAGVRAAAEDPASSLTPARRRNIVAAADYLDVAPGVVQVVRDVPVPPGLDLALPRAPRDPAAVDALAARWGLNTSVQRLVAVLAGGS